MLHGSSAIVMLVSLALVTVAGGAVASQVQQTGTIVGRVADENGGLLPGVTIEARSPALIRHETTVTDEKGAYRLPLLPIGDYTLTFALEGFSTTVRQGVRVSADRTVTLAVTLGLAGLTENVTVSGEAPVVDVRSATAAVNLDRKVIDELPTSRDIWSLLQSQAPQVVTSTEDVGGSESGLQAGFSAHGSSRRQNTFMFNGINTTGVNSTGTTDLYFDYDSFEEVQISTAAHKAEVSTPGVYLNIVPRSGSDQWRGAVQNFFSDRNLQSDNIDGTLRERGISRGQGVNLINGASVQLGGPLIRERWRIHGSYRDDRIKRFVVGFPLSEDTIIKAPLVNSSLQVNPANRLDTFFTYNKYDKPRRGAGALVAPESTSIEDNHATVAGVSWLATLGSNTQLDLRFAHVGNVFQLFSQPDARHANTREQTTGFVTGASNGLQNRHERKQLSGSLSHYKSDWLGGNHEFKIGYDISRGPNETLRERFDDVNLVLSRGQAFSVTLFESPALPRELHWFFPFYVQDAYTRGRLTFSTGLRYEYYKGKVRESEVAAGRFAPARSFPAKDGPTFSKLLPRVAAAVDVFGDARLAIKASYGRYAHTPGSPWFSAISEAELASASYRWTDLNGDGRFQEGEQGALLSRSGGSITALDPDLRQPFTDEITAGIESGVLRDVRLSATVVFRQERDLIAQTNPGVPFSSYSPVQARDPGADGVTGTTDDALIEVFNQAASTLGRDRRLITNPAFESTYRGVEFVAQRRFADNWQWLASLALSSQDLNAAGVSAVAAGGGAEQETGSPFLDPNLRINNTSGPGFFDRTYSFKTSGSYQFPLGILVSGVFKAQSGTPWSRVVTIQNDINGVPLNQGSVSVYAEARGTRRFPTLKMIDLRVSKSFSVDRHRLDGILDVFNAANANTVTSINGQTGSQFGAPLAILGPRVVRLGVRYSF
jgi:hypothetical protein